MSERYYTEGRVILGFGKIEEEAINDYKRKLKLFHKNSFGGLYTEEEREERFREEYKNPENFAKWFSKETTEFNDR